MTQLQIRTVFLRHRNGADCRRLLKYAAAQILADKKVRIFARKAVEVYGKESSMLAGSAVKLALEGMRCKQQDASLKTLQARIDTE
ncbi:hypothetical protein BaRGS_00016508 [Batillaria attramentaria]|uniref:Uncharacterized protein n=1 Tax=Batillaria attramentaria TaxID=370345 RepID=A0ABD0KYP9_9CAEN